MVSVCDLSADHLSDVRGWLRERTTRGQRQARKVKRELEFIRSTPPKINDAYRYVSTSRASTSAPSVPPPLLPSPPPPGRTNKSKDHNIDVLDRAGVLGAVLALIAREAGSVRQNKRTLSKTSTDCLQVSVGHRLECFETSKYRVAICQNVEVGIRSVEGVFPSAHPLALPSFLYADTYTDILRYIEVSNFGTPDKAHRSLSRRLVDILPAAQRS